MGENSEIYDLLVDIKNGEDPGYYIKRYDDLAEYLNFNSKRPGMSIVTITFDNDSDYYDMFEDLSDDDIWWINRFRYNDYDSYDYDNGEIEDSWKGGYIYNYYMNDENKNKVDKLINISNLNAFDKPVEERMRIFIDNFWDTASAIYGEFFQFEHVCRMDNAKEEIFEDLGNKFSKFGIREIVPLYKYKTSVNILIKLFDTIGDKTMTLKELLTHIIKNYTKESYGYYDELYHQTNCDEFDSEGFNRECEWHLDKVLDKLEDTVEFVNVENFFVLIDLVNDKYGFDKWYEFKTKKGVHFKINKIDPKTNKIIVDINDLNTKKTSQRSLTYDELLRMETQYELFTENRKKRKKNFLI